MLTLVECQYLDHAITVTEREKPFLEVGVLDFASMIEEDLSTRVPSIVYFATTDI